MTQERLIGFLLGMGAGTLLGMLLSVPTEDFERLRVEAGGASRTDPGVWNRLNAAGHGKVLP